MTETLIRPTPATHDTITRWFECVGDRHDTAVSVDSADAGKGILVCGSCENATMPPSDLVRRIVSTIQARVVVGAMSSDCAPRLFGGCCAV